MRLDQVEYVADLKDKLEQQQERLALLNRPRVSFTLNIKQAGRGYTLLSNPNSGDDKERNSLKLESVNSIMHFAKQETIARITYYTQKLNKLGVEVKSHIRAA